MKIVFLPQSPNLSLYSDHNQNWGKGEGFKHILVTQSNFWNYLGGQCLTCMFEIWKSFCIWNLQQLHQTAINLYWGVDSQLTMVMPSSVD